MLHMLLYPIPARSINSQNRNKKISFARQLVNSCFFLFLSFFYPFFNRNNIGESLVISYILQFLRLYTIHHTCTLVQVLQVAGKRSHLLPARIHLLHYLEIQSSRIWIISRFFWQKDNSLQIKSFRKKKIYFHPSTLY